MVDIAVILKLQSVVASCGSQQKAARKLGLSQAYLGELLRGTRTPGPKVLAALGLRKQTSYVEDGHAD
jgi:hypothetical protein